MLIKAEQKYVRTSPRKLRLVLDSVRMLKNPQKMILYLEQVPKRASLPLVKVLKQAIANSKNNFGQAEENLRLKEITINAGPVYKRGQPVSRGRFHPIIKRTSHIRVILETKDEKRDTQNAIRNAKRQEGKEVAV